VVRCGAERQERFAAGFSGMNRPNESHEIDVRSHSKRPTTLSTLLEIRPGRHHERTSGRHPQPRGPSDLPHLPPSGRQSDIRRSASFSSGLSALAAPVAQPTTLTRHRIITRLELRSCPLALIPRYALTSSPRGAVRFAVHEADRQAPCVTQAATLHAAV